MFRFPAVFHLSNGKGQALGTHQASEKNLSVLFNHTGAL